MFTYFALDTAPTTYTHCCVRTVSHVRFAGVGAAHAYTLVSSSSVSHSPFHCHPIQYTPARDALVKCSRIARHTRENAFCHDYTSVLCSTSGVFECRRINTLNAVFASKPIFHVSKYVEQFGADYHYGDG